MPGEFCYCRSGKKSSYPHQNRISQLPEGWQGIESCSACGKPDEIGKYRHGWCLKCLRRWYRADCPESGPPPLRSRYAAVETWRQVPVPVVEREVSMLQAGTAAEHLVCADLLLQGYLAFMADQNCPYDVAVDVGSLIRVQVKSTHAPRIVSGTASEPVYKFGVERSGKRELYADGAFDLYALVALDLRLIAYLPTFFRRGRTVHIRQPGTRAGKHFVDFPFAKAVADLGLL